MDIAHFLDFDFSTSALGTLRICALEDQLYKAIRKEVQENEVDARKLAIRIFLNVAHRLTRDKSIDGVCAGPAIAPGDATSLLDSELDRFAEKYGALFFGKCDGRGPSKTQPGGVDFLVFQIKESIRLDNERHARLLNEAKKLYSSVTLDAMARNGEVSDRLNSAIRDYITPEPSRYRDAFKPPINPINETNDVLARLLGQLEQMRPVFGTCAELIQSMNSTALKMQSDSTVAAARADRLAAQSMKVATIGIYISLAALFSSCGFSLWTIVDARNATREADRQSTALQNEIRDATAAANKARGDLEFAAAEDRRALVRALANGIPPNKNGQSKSNK